MAECLAEIFIGEWKVVVIILTTKFSNKLTHVIFMHKFSTLFGWDVTSCLCAEEILKFEHFILSCSFKELVKHRRQVKSKDIHVWEYCIWIWHSCMKRIIVPCILSCLLINIVPSIDFIILEILIQVERSSRKVQHSGIFFIFSKSCLMLQIFQNLLS